MLTKTLAVAALMAFSACAPFWATKDGTSRSWFTPLANEIGDDATGPGAALYAANCAYCHGDAGLGDGAPGQMLPVSPPDLTGLTAANDGVFPAEMVMETIHGYPGKFHRGSMPEFGHVLKGPVVEWRAPSGEVIMTPKRLLDLVAYVESLQAEEDA